MTPPLSAGVTFEHGPQRPRRVPLLPGLDVGRSYYDYHSHRGSPKRYRSDGPDSLAISDGPDLFNQVLMGDGAWYLHAGDRPALRLAHRPYWPNSYIKPDLIPGLGVSGDLYFAALSDGEEVPLHLRARVEARFSPGEAEWSCAIPRPHEPGPPGPSAPVAQDTHVRTTAAETRSVAPTPGGTDPARQPRPAAPSAASGATSHRHLRLRARPLVSTNGCVLLVEGNTALAVRLDLAADPDSAGKRVRTPPGPRRGAGYLVLDHPGFPYTRVAVGTTAGAAAAIEVQSDTCAVLTLRPGDGLLLVWGYSDYDREGLAAAYRRLEQRPFAAPGWVARMRERWFEHWVGRCLHPERRFRRLMERFPEAAAEAVEFWHPRRRLRIETPEPAFDTVVNRAAVEFRYQFEYPAFIHGILGWNKYGKINFGYYAADDAGMHDEVSDSLHFISGSQDPGGRQRYLSAAFHTISWAEEVDFYFVEQVWHHYRWTADRAFLAALYPAARRSLEHALGASDPDATGIMTGYYEFWQNDAHSRGGKCVVHGALAWGALGAAAAMAQVLGHEEDAARYGRYAALVRRRLERELWHEQQGAFGSAEWNGDVRPRPETQEQFLPALRGLGSARQRRRAARYLRDRFFLRPAAGVTLELINDWWPIFWSHHYVANGDALLSVLAAARSGDIDGYWPLVRCIVEGALTSSDGSLRSTQDNSGRGTGLRHTAEVQAPLLQMVAEGLFGIHPALHENRLRLRPRFPRHWPHARLQRPGLALSYRRESARSLRDTEDHENGARGSARWPPFSDQDSPETSIILEVTCDSPRQVTAVLPVRAEVRSVTVNGASVTPRFTADVGAARLVLDSGASGGSRRHRFVVKLAPEVEVSVPERVVVGAAARCRVSGARVQGWEERSGRVAGDRRPDGLTLRASAAGRTTGFLRLSTGQAEWDEPVDLETVPPWELVERLTPALVNERAAVLSPRLDSASRSLLLELRNNTPRRLAGAARALGCSTAVTLEPESTRQVRLDLSPAWSMLSPGTLPVTVTFDGSSATGAASSWRLAPTPQRWSGAERVVPVDLSAAYNADAGHLYGPGFRWRLDYTGCGVGVDRRRPPPARDARGYVLHHSPMGQLSWGCLPEHTYGLEQEILPEFDLQWEFPPLPPEYEPLPGLRFRTGGRRLLALAATEPYAQLPSSALLDLTAGGTARALEKLYLLTANLTKTVKSYYPAGEITIHYDSGDPQHLSLVPPHTVSCMAQPFCPRAWHVPYGRFHGALSSYGPVEDEKIPNLAVQDLVTDPTRGVTALELRCVASETLLGLLALSMLPAIDAGDGQVMSASSASAAS